MRSCESSDGPVMSIHAGLATFDGLACESTSQPAKKDYAPDGLAVEVLFVLTYSTAPASKWLILLATEY